MKFMTKISVAAMLMLAIATNARADIAAVGVVHDYISRKWNIDIPYDKGTKTQIASMRYVMQAVDAVNEQINNVRSSNYGTDKQYASGLASSTAAETAIDTLVKKLDYHFFFTPATDEKTYTFQISAAGTFFVDWGDGKIERIDKTDTKLTEYSHEYTDGRPANAHEIALAGKATQYNTGNNAAIRFYNGKNENTYQIQSMHGCLGCVFSTINDETIEPNMRQPKFYQTFRSNPSLTVELYADLFNGVHGAPVEQMFSETFAGCSNLTGEIPADLFAEIKGAPMKAMFSSTFSTCPGLTGIGGALFRGIKGAPANSMFSNTFYGCSGLTGEIPPGLFGKIDGPTATSMFYRTFFNNSELTGIPDDLFGDIYGDVLGYMFFQTFAGCKSLVGPSAKVGKDGEREYLYERWPDNPNSGVTGISGAYIHAGKLSDFACIPTAWGGSGTKEPGTCKTNDENAE